MVIGISGVHLMPLLALQIVVLGCDWYCVSLLGLGLPFVPGPSSSGPCPVPARAAGCQLPLASGR
eukprot:7184607-Karenia_brevis.AAC.1